VLRKREEARRSKQCATDQDQLPLKRPDPATAGIF
jgi:hypothetical protein